MVASDVAYRPLYNIILIVISCVHAYVIVSCMSAGREGWQGKTLNGSSKGSHTPWVGGLVNVKCGGGMLWRPQETFKGRQLPGQAGQAEQLSLLPDLFAHLLPC